MLSPFLFRERVISCPCLRDYRSWHCKLCSWLCKMGVHGAGCSGHSGRIPDASGHSGRFQQCSEWAPWLSVLFLLLLWLLRECVAAAAAAAEAVAPRMCLFASWRFVCGGRPVASNARTLPTFISSQPSPCVASTAETRASFSFDGR